MQQEEKMRMNNQRLGSNGIREVQDGSLLAGTRLKDVRTDANDGAPNSVLPTSQNLNRKKL